MLEKRSYWQQETKKFTWKHARILLIAEEINRDRNIRSVLDLGAGEALLHRLLDPRISYRGLDIAGEKDGTRAYPPVDYYDFDHLDSNAEVAGSPYDCVVISGLLEYLENWEQLITMAREKWLKPGGVCLVSFINTKGYRENAPVKDHPMWKHKFMLPQILRDLERLGLKVEKVYPIFWGSKSWLRPLIKFWAEVAWELDKVLSMDRTWVSQFLLITRANTNYEK